MLRDNDYGDRDASGCDGGNDGIIDCACGNINRAADRTLFTTQARKSIWAAMRMDGSQLRDSKWGCAHVLGVRHSSDGRGDYVTIDQTSQRREATTTYSQDGSISLWFWKRECTVAGGFEWLYSHQNNNEDIYNTVHPDAEWTTVPIINSDEERRAWMALPYTDMFCQSADFVSWSARLPGRCW